MIVIVECGFTCSRPISRTPQGKDARRFPYAIRVKVPRRLRRPDQPIWAERRYETLEQTVAALVAMGIDQRHATYQVWLCRNYRPRNEMVRPVPWHPQPQVEPMLLRHIMTHCPQEVAELRAIAREHNPCLHNTNGDCALAKRICTEGDRCPCYRNRYQRVLPTYRHACGGIFHHRFPIINNDLVEYECSRCQKRCTPEEAQEYDKALAVVLAPTGDDWTEAVMHGTFPEL